MQKFAYCFLFIVFEEKIATLLKFSFPTFTAYLFVLCLWDGKFRQKRLKKGKFSFPHTYFILVKVLGNTSDNAKK